MVLARFIISDDDIDAAEADAVARYGTGEVDASAPAGEADTDGEPRPEERLPTP